jgi:hypothetical protein
MGMFCRSVFVLFILATYKLNRGIALKREKTEKAKIELDLPFIVPQLYIFEMIHRKPNAGRTDKDYDIGICCFSA